MNALQRVTIGIALLSISCSQSDDSVSPDRQSGEDKLFRSVKAVVGPAGGTIAFGDGTSLVIGAGSLSGETTITLSKLVTSNGVSADGFEFLRVEPSDLVLDAPAIVRLAYDESASQDGDLLAGYAFSEADSNWQRLPVLQNDTEAGFIEFQIERLSWIATIFERPLDLVMEIPGRYLKQSDLLYCLALTSEDDKFTWFPGHAALYLGARKNAESANDGATIVESGPPNGVRFSTLSAFAEATTHLYMGARRYDGSLTAQNRIDIAEYAIDKIGHGYSLIGEGNVWDGKYSCVGLTEASFDAAGKSIIPAVLEFPFILPIEQFARTVPVGEVTVMSGETFRLPVKGVVWNEENGEYRDSNSDFTASVTGLPPGASFQNNVLKWTPDSDHVGFTFSPRLTAKATSDGKLYERTQSLAITVGMGGTTLISNDFEAYPIGFTASPRERQ